MVRDHKVLEHMVQDHMVLDYKSKPKSQKGIPFIHINQKSTNNFHVTSL